MSETLALRIARRHVDSYTNELDVIQQHQEAMECQDCEDLLQLGIEAFRWLIRADETIRRAAHSGQAEYTHESEEALRELFVAWVESCAFAEKWTITQLDRGYQVKNLDQFRHYCEQGRAIVESFSDASLTEDMGILRDLALEEHRDGKTSEFLEEI